MTVLPDYLAPGLRVVFCGTAVSATSAARGHYYAGPGNEFWPLLHQSGLTPVLLTPDDDAHVLDFGLGSARAGSPFMARLPGEPRRER
jgi:TDG/mug DNA glycosylase family protein